MKCILVIILFILLFGCGRSAESDIAEPEVVPEVIEPTPALQPETEIDNLEEDMDLLDDEDIDLSEFETW